MSSVVKIIPKNKKNINLSKFENFTREIFKHKRKKISNVLNVKDKNFDNQILNSRAEDLKTYQLLELFKKFYNF